MYLQLEMAEQFLKDIYKTNEAHFKEMTVDLSRYGFMDQTGNHDQRGEACPRRFDERRKVWNDEWKKHISAVEQQSLDKHLVPLQKDRISHHVKEPKTLAEICEYAMANPRLSTCAVAEVLEQLYNQDQRKVLILCDQYSDWFRPSNLKSFRYPYNRYFIPPEDIALVRLFHRFDGHLIRNGVKVCASSTQDFKNARFTPQMINFPDQFFAAVKPHRLNDTRHLINCMQLCGLYGQRWYEWQIESLHMEGQGNPGDIMRQMKETFHVEDVQ